jgi:FKBP-type peptidyl-prolyl cis-trans isomerase SlyD
MKVAPGCKITIEFELKAKGGEVIETSRKAGPLIYIHGEGKLLPALEKLMDGMEVGDEKKGVIPAKDAFGDETKAPTTTLLRKEFPAGEKLEVGKVFGAKGVNGQPMNFRIVEAAKDKITVRILHPLAEVDIEYWVRILVVDDPSQKKRAAMVPPPPPEALGLKKDDE